MLFATKKNRQRRIADSDKNYYASLGYIITKADGTVVSKPANAEEEAAKLKAENAALREELAALKAATDSASVAVSENESAVAVTIEETAQVEPETQTTAKRATKKKAAATGE